MGCDVNNDIFSDPLLLQFLDTDYMPLVCIFSLKTRKKQELQSNLSIMGMLYSGYLVTANTVSPNHGQTLIEKPLYSVHF